MTWRACWELDAGESSGRHVSSLAKVFVSEAVMRSIDRSLQLCGGLGASHDLPLARAYADARLFSIYDGANDVHRMAIARRLLRAAHGSG